MLTNLQNKVQSRRGFLFRLQNTQNREKGQSTIEFLSSFTFVVGILFLFVKFSINITNGFLVHYGTFMASRTYMTYDNNSNDSVDSDAGGEALAQEVFEQMKISNFLGSSKIDLNFNKPLESKAIYVGVSASFKQSFGAFKFVGGSTPLSLTSESFLGREPTRADCSQRICDAMESIGAECAGSFQTLFDNGC